MIPRGRAREPAQPLPKGVRAASLRGVARSTRYQDTVEANALTANAEIGAKRAKVTGGRAELHDAEMFKTETDAIHAGLCEEHNALAAASPRTAHARNKVPLGDKRRERS